MNKRSFMKGLSAFMNFDEIHETKRTALLSLTCIEVPVARREYQTAIKTINITIAAPTASDSLLVLLFKKISGVETQRINACSRFASIDPCEHERA